ncbi:TldD/PmbA family protein [Vallitalea guaymasensis]|uniref:TldD/PmbA family protein n=1 Tax=Vallitalea guaymasensis TaxID=1185412 RepID=UPI00235346D5|nr:TldD/PmbA family protein [Vallitalea guaymasensis]
MDNKKIIKMLFDKGKKAGFEEMEVYIHNKKGLSIKVFKGDVDTFENSVEEGLSFRGLYNNKMGYSYTEKLDESCIDMLIEEAMENAKIIDNDDVDIIFEGSKEYKNVITYNRDSEKISTEQKIDYLIQLEKEIFKKDNRVVAMPYNILEETTNSTIISNTKGLNLEYKSNRVETYAFIDVKEDGDVKAAYRYKVADDLKKIDGKSIATEIVDEAISMLGATQIKSGKYPIILRADVSAQILRAFAPIFSADNVHKDLSLLKGKIGEKIANPAITIVDDPFMKGGAYTKPFDAEGVASKYKKLVSNGILKTYFHNLKTATKDGVESTGNAYKAAYNSIIDIAPTNMYIEIGKKSLDELIGSVEEGLLIIDVQGLHSGLNTISGDFSVSAYGYEIKQGKIARPVNQITISGNYIEMMKNIEDIGNDLEFVMPSRGYVGSPSLKISSLSVAGE